MSSSESLTKKAILRLIRLSLYFTVVIVASLSFISIYFLKQSKFLQFDRKITSTLNNVFTYEFRSNPEAILKKIQEKTSLSEVAIYNSSCSLLAFSSISLAFQQCPSNSALRHIEANLGEEKLHIFYNEDFSLIELLQKNLTQIILISIATFTITAFGLVLFLYESFIKPMNIIQSQIQADQDLALPREFGLIASKLTNFKSIIAKNEKDRAHFELARRVVHDIRNPLTFLKLHLSSRELDLEAIRSKIDEIDYQISNLLGSTKKEFIELSIQGFFESMAKELEFGFNIKCSLRYQTQDHLKLPLNLFDLKNIIYNLAKNSSEAGAKEVSIECVKSPSFLEIVFIDNGPGIPKELWGQVVKGGLTTKTDGNGIGIYSLKSFLQSVNGDLDLDLTQKKGTKIILKIPIINPIKELVFIDDDKYLRKGWVSSGHTNNVVVHAFQSVEDFLKSDHEIGKHVPIYIDSDLGPNLQGERLAKSIFERGFQKIYLATSFDTIDITPYPWVLSVTSKHPPFC